MTDEFQFGIEELEFFEILEDYLDVNIYMPLLDLIKKLEERIIALERK
eukprot:gene4005-437_t